MLLKCCIQYDSKFGKLSNGHRTGKGQFSLQSQRRAMPKSLNYHTIRLISHASKVMLEILQNRLQQNVNWELPDVQTHFRKGRGARDQIANIRWIIKKQESSRKTSISALLTMPKPLTVWITINYGKFLRDGNTRPPDLPLENSVCKSGRNSENWTWNNRLEKEYIKAVYCHPAYLTYMQSTS